MKLAKKILSFLLGVVVTTSVFSTLSLKGYATDNIETNVFVTGDGIWEDPEAADIPIFNEKVENLRLPSYVDNSNSIYFPVIGNQGEMESCAGWASTYYQFTYEVNKLKGVATTSSNTYSPSWTYNYINGGCNVPTNISNAYEILMNHGALLLNDYPHAAIESQYSYTWSTNVNKMTNALHYRVDYQGVNVLSTFSDYMTEVKNRLSNGHIATIWTNTLGWDIQPSTTGESVIIRGGLEGYGGHYMTVVGYDDTVTVNYKGATFTGAFKLANSWGTSWPDGNNGFIWVAYDALNIYSTEGTYWQSEYSNTRAKIFGDYNTFYFVTPEYFPNYFVGKVSYVSNDPWYNYVYADTSNYANSLKFRPFLGSEYSAPVEHPRPVKLNSSVA